MTISKKIIILVTATAACLSALLCVVGFFLISASADKAARAQLEATGKAVRDIIQTSVNVQETVAIFIALDPDLPKALAAKDTKALRDIATTLVKTPAIDMVTICDPSGLVLARGHSDKAGDVLPLSRISFAVPLKTGKVILGMEPGNVVPLTLTSGTPIMHEGKIVGVVIVGENMASGTFVKRVEESLDVECTIFLGDKRVSTTVTQNGQPIIGTTLDNAPLYEKVMGNSETIYTRDSINGEEYDAVYWPWKDMEGKTAGMFFVGASRADAIAAERQAMLYFIAIGIGLGLVFMLIGAYVARAIARPLRSATAYAETVAAGNFDEILTVTGKDEAATLSSALLTMVGNLKAKIAEADAKSAECSRESDRAAAALREAEAASKKTEESRENLLRAAGDAQRVADRLASATEQLSAKVHYAASRAEKQREEVAGSASAMEEMTATVIGVAHSASAASESSERAKSNALSGERIVEESAGAISAVQRDTQSLREGMLSLGDQAEAIGRVMTVISDIADQTNLLALNAAIEAARAGEAGRGFAVVADEVRKLAEKTMVATHEVGEAITGIQQGTRTNIDAVAMTAATLEKATSLVVDSGASLADIVIEANHTADQIRAIATAAEEQSASSEAIARSLEDINAIALETAATMHEASEAVADLSHQAHELQALVDSLKS